MNFLCSEYKPNPSLVLRSLLLFISSRTPYGSWAPFLPLISFSFFTGLPPEAYKHPLPSPTGRWDSWTHIPLRLPPISLFIFIAKCCENIAYTWCFHIRPPILLNPVHSGFSPLHSAETASVKITSVTTTCHVSGQVSPHLTTFKQHLTQLIHSLLLV